MQFPMAPNASKPGKLFGLIATTALAAVLPLTGAAQGQKARSVEGCALIDGRLPDDCTRLDAGTVVTMPPGDNTEMATGMPALNGEGFAITIEPAGPAAARRAGDRAPSSTDSDLRRMDRALSDAGIVVSYDGLGIHPYLAISTEDMRSSYTAGSNVVFTTSTNYPAYIGRAEIRVLDRDDPGKVIKVLPVPANGKAVWTMPKDGAGNMTYSLRVYDAAGRYDETRHVPIARVEMQTAAPVLDGPVIAAGEGVDMATRRDIPIRGGAVTVSSDNLMPGARVRVMGEDAVADGSGIFVI